MPHAVALLAALGLWLGLIAALRRQLAQGSYSSDQVAAAKGGQLVMSACAAAWAGGVADALIRLVWRSAPGTIAVGFGVVVGVAVAVALVRREYADARGSGRWFTPPARLWAATARTNSSRALIAAFLDAAAVVLWVPVPNGAGPRVPAVVLAALVTLLGGLATAHWWRSRPRGIEA
jgi:hypothetical protein